MGGGENEVVVVIVVVMMVVVGTAREPHHRPITPFDTTHPPDSTLLALDLPPSIPLLCILCSFHQRAYCGFALINQRVCCGFALVCHEV